jgi:hypothetical protein
MLLFDKRDKAEEDENAARVHGDYDRKAKNSVENQQIAVHTQTKKGGRPDKKIEIDFGVVEKGLLHHMIIKQFLYVMKHSPDPLSDFSPPSMMLHRISPHYGRIIPYNTKQTTGMSIRGGNISPPFFDTIFDILRLELRCFSW